MLKKHTWNKVTKHCPLKWLEIKKHTPTRPTKKSAFKKKSNWHRYMCVLHKTCFYVEYWQQVKHNFKPKCSILLSISFDTGSYSLQKEEGSSFKRREKKNLNDIFVSTHIYIKTSNGLFSAFKYEGGKNILKICKCLLSCGIDRYFWQWGQSLAPSF